MFRFLLLIFVIPSADSGAEMADFAAQANAVVAAVVGDPDVDTTGAGADSRQKNHSADRNVWESSKKVLRFCRERCFFT